jgi:hypothetical protein
MIDRSIAGHILQYPQFTSHSRQTSAGLSLYAAAAGPFWFPLR